MCVCVCARWTREAVNLSHATTTKTKTITENENYFKKMNDKKDDDYDTNNNSI